MRQILAIVILSLTIGCGSSKNPSDTDAGTGTDTGTVTSTDTGTQTDTGTSTKTDTTTATSTFKYTDACDYAKGQSVTGGDAPMPNGVLVVTTTTKPGESWNLCITGESADDIQVVGYAYKTSELGMTNPPSLVAYSGVAGKKCIILNPDTTASAGPVVEGTGVFESYDYTITNGVTTATWSSQTGACFYRRPGT